MPDCLFCKIVSDELPSLKLWENEQFLVFMNINPVVTGHILLIPKEHFDKVFELPELLYTELFATAKKLSEPLQRAMGSARTGMVVEGFGVAHAHVHLMPVNKAREMNPEHEHHMEFTELAPIAEKIKKTIAEKLNNN
jgi:histidine triad (HIT) family protein